MKIVKPFKQKNSFSLPPSLSLSLSLFQNFFNSVFLCFFPHSLYCIFFIHFNFSFYFRFFLKILNVHFLFLFYGFPLKAKTCSSLSLSLSLSLTHTHTHILGTSPNLYFCIFFPLSLYCIFLTHFHYSKSLNALLFFCSFLHKRRAFLSFFLLIFFLSFFSILLLIFFVTFF